MLLSVEGLDEPLRRTAERQHESDMTSILFSSVCSHLHLAYLDPGTGSMILQALLAGLAGLVVFLKYQGRRLTSLLGIKRKREIQKDTNGG